LEVGWVVEEILEILSAEPRKDGFRSDAMGGGRRRKGNEREISSLREVLLELG
jgi:hypothetical protein